MSPVSGMLGTPAGLDDTAGETPAGRRVVDVYEGAFGIQQAERLLWRAGFGPRPGEAATVAAQGLAAAVAALLEPGPELLLGPPPHDGKGQPLAPYDVWGDDHCWWLDRMVRTSRPLVERMTLIWHSWFATSNEGVGSQRLMIAQNELFRSHALGRFDELLLDVTHDPAMLLWLNGAQNVKESPNENYAREMMELFTLGANRGAYSETDVRQQARSLTGWQNGWSQSGPDDFHYDAGEHDGGVKHVFGQSGRFGWQDACLLCLRHPLHASFVVEKLWSYFVPTPPDATTLAGLEELYRPSYEITPVVQAILMHPAFHQGPAHGHPAGRLYRRPAAPHRSGHHDDRLGLDRTDGGPAALLSAERRWLGLHPLAEHRDLPRSLDRRSAHPRGPPARPRPSAARRGRRRLRARRARARVLARSAALRSDVRPAHLLREPCPWRGERLLGEAGLPGAGRERAAPVDRRDPRPADRMRRHCCDEFARRVVAGEGLRAIEPGMPAPAGSGMTRRGFVASSLGLALTVYGAGRLGLFEGGIAEAASGPQARILVSVFLPGGADGLSMLYPGGDPLYAKLRPRLALSGGTAFREDARLFWHPALAPLAELYAEGKVTAMPAIGYSHPDQSHFTSRHYWEVGATSVDLQTGWLGRYLDATASADNPLQGLSLTGQLEPTLATDRVPVAALSAPNQYVFYVPQVWGPAQDRMLDALGHFGALATGDAALDSAAGVAVESDRLRRQLLPFAGQTTIASPVTYPASSQGFPQQLAGLAAMIGAWLPLRCVALEAADEYDTHSGEAATLSAALQLTASSLLAFQRDLEARGVADRVVTLVWSEFGRRAQENASNGTDHGAAGAAFLIGTRVSGHMIGEFPGLAHGLDELGNLKPTADFRGVYAALLEQWLCVRRRADPARRGELCAPAADRHLSLRAAPSRRC